MNQPPHSLLELVAARRGHFLLESGYHGGLWLDLDGLFRRPERIAPLVDVLAERLRPFRPAAVCGPLQGGAFLAQLLAQSLGAEFWYTQRGAAEGEGLFSARYHLPRALAAGARRQRVALVDDVMSAGSSRRASLRELRRCGAEPVAVAAPLVLGAVGESFFAEQGLPVIAGAREPYELWKPESCPRCTAGIPVERPA